MALTLSTGEQGCKGAGIDRALETFGRLDALEIFKRFNQKLLREN